MKCLKTLLPLGLGLLPLAGAQQSGQQPTPEMRARMAQMQPVIDLAQTVRLLPELEKNQATAVTRAQAKSLLTLLTALQKAKAVQPNDARKYLSQIEDRILTDRQLTVIDDLTLKAEQARAAQPAGQPGGQGQRGLRIPGVPGAFGGQRPGGTGQNAGRQNSAGQGSPANMQPGQFNPFTRGRGADDLKRYIEVLRKK